MIKKIGRRKLTRCEGKNAFFVEITVNADVATVSADKHRAGWIGQRNIIGRARNCVGVKDEAPIVIDQREVNPTVGIRQDQRAEVDNVYRIPLLNDTGLK